VRAPISPALPLAAAVVLMSSFNGRSDVVVLNPAADTTLIGAAPNNNNGGQIFVNAGVTQNGPTNRGLFRFDIAAGVPAGSKITRAELTLEVVHQPPTDGYKEAAFDLHRLLEPWGEGSKTNSSSPPSPNPGLGEPATTNEATWNARFAFTTNLWAVPGAAATSDYVPAVSSSQFVYGLVNSPYTFESTPLMIADVQLWLDHPGNNFGWILKADDEGVKWTACRFGSREDPQNAPLLTVEYEPGIDQVQVSGNQFTLTFAAQAGQSYTVEFRDSLTVGSGWSMLTNIGPQPMTTNIAVSDAIRPGQRFYRLELP
jgi:hypothetical protein